MSCGVPGLCGVAWSPSQQQLPWHLRSWCTPWYTLPRPAWSSSAEQSQSHLPPGLWEVIRHWITDARLLSAGWDLTLFLRAVRRAAVWPHPSSAFAETGYGTWWDSPNIGPATLVPPAKNKVRWNPLMTTPRQMQSVLGPVYKPRPVYQMDNPLHNMVRRVSQNSILETAPHQVFTFAKFFHLRCKLFGLFHLLLQIKIQGDLQ